jgi:putative alpha-1,2-mannosidase
MGFYPDDATEPFYTFTTPVFDRITLQLNPDHYGGRVLEMEVIRPGKNARFIDKIVIDGKKVNSYRISHGQLSTAKKIVFYLKERKG